MIRRRRLTHGPVVISVKFLRNNGRKTPGPGLNGGGKRTINLINAQGPLSTNPRQGILVTCLTRWVVWCLLIKDVAELYDLADKYARAEEGRRLPSEDAGTGADSKDGDADAPAKKGRRRNKKRKSKAVFAIEVSGNVDTAKKSKADAPGKDVSGYAPYQALAATNKLEGSGKQYCKLHRTKGHDL
ncbi:hypothetical protein ZWY2020_005981 [Hordeum vulgare]|nr:hypothetical protein ZWY2020_005981 [Hordeum vulgare]